MQSPIEQLRSYAGRYHSAYIVDDGFCQWDCCTKATSLAAIAQKAIRMGCFSVNYNRHTNHLTISY